MAGFSVITYALCNKNTQKVISEAIKGLSEGMTFKGQVNTLADLPEDPSNGDLYIIKSNKSKAVFFDNNWIEFDHELSLIAGQNIDIELDSEGNTIISSTGGSGGTSDYNELDNLPSINGITLLGDKDASEFNIQDKFNAGPNVYFYNDSEGDLYLDAKVDPSMIALELPNALKQVLSEQVEPSGLTIDSEGNIKLDIDEEYFELGSDNKLTLKQWLILDANEDTTPGENPIVDEGKVDEAIVGDEDIATVDNATVDNSVVGDESGGAYVDDNDDLNVSGLITNNVLEVNGSVDNNGYLNI